MKKLLLIAGLLLYLGNVGYAQITLSSSGYPASLLGTDSLRKTVHGSPFPSLAVLSGGLCDMTSLVDTMPNFFNYRVPSLSIYQFADSAEFKSNFSGYAYFGETETNVNSGGIRQYSVHIEDTSYSLFPVTSGSIDSLFIPAQNSAFSTLHTKIAFPASVGSSWYSAWYSDLNFEVSIAAYSLYHTPGVVRRYTTESNAVIGWGKMRVNDASGIPSDYLDVLQVKTITQTIDSFFLSGAPMSPIVLGVLHLTQGKQDTVYAQNYYREHEVTPLANVVFRDAGYTQPYKATTHIQRLKPSGVSELRAGSITIYPNPAARLLTLQLPGAAVNWRYELISLSGAVVQSGNIIPGGNTGTLEINAAVAAGVYFLRLGDGSRVYTQQLVISQ